MAMPPANHDGIVWQRLFPSLNQSDAALQTQIRQALVSAIESRYLLVGTRLPSSRKLAEILDVARNTVVFAYEQLIDEGYLVSHERSGVFVAPDAVLAKQGEAEQGDRHASWRGHFAMRPSQMQHITKPRDWQRYPYPFLFGQFDPGLFPTASWRESVTAASSVSNIHDWAGDQIDDDDPELVAQLCSQVLPRRGIWAAQNEAMITIGAQQALYLVTQLLVGVGTPVAIEEPGYPDTRNMVRLAGGILHPLAIDAEGAVPDAGLTRSRLLIVTPGHQCPTTAVMSLTRRKALLSTARAHNMLVVEDDYDADLLAEGSGVPPLKSLDPDGRVIYIGSLSKVLAPGLRLGYVVASAEVISELRVLRRLILRHPPTNNQRSMAMFISLGHYRGHLRRTAATLGERGALIDQTLAETLPDFAWQRGAGAASHWITGPEGFDAQEAAFRAREAGVLIEPGDVFFADAERGRRCFRLGFSSIRTDRIREGLVRFGRVVADTRPVQGTRSRSS